MTLLIIGAGIGALATCLLAWPTAALVESGRRWSSQRHERVAETRNAKQRQLLLVAKEKIQADAARREAEELRRLREERVGRRFRWRASSDDSGMIGTIVDLEPSRPSGWVLLHFESPHGRVTTPYDYGP